MTTQEAKIKSNVPRKQHDLTTSELYFPNLRSSYHSILSGDFAVCNSHIPESGKTLELLPARYQKGLKYLHATTDLPIKAEFTVDGLELSVVRPVPDGGVRTPDDEVVFITLGWIADVAVLTQIAKLLDKINLDCARIIPTLAADFTNFRNIYQIEMNPIFDFMAFTYALFHKLKILDSVPKCYVQVLMCRRKTTYLSLVQAVKYRTTLPASVTSWFESDIVKEKPYSIKNDEGKPFETINVWSLLLIDYAGKAFNHQLKLQVSPRNNNFEGLRNIVIATDEEVCPN